MDNRTVVHLVRHGEVHNPKGLLYGRLPGFRLSDQGRSMAQDAAEALAQCEVAYLGSSPLERAMETASPIAETTDCSIREDEDLIEASNVFEGWAVSMDNVFRNPRTWRHLVNPFRPSWSEPYRSVANRMRRAVERARTEALGREAVLVSHQLPIWIARRDLQRRPLPHNPRRRECSLASITSLHFVGPRFAYVTYAEPAAGREAQRR